MFVFIKTEKKIQFQNREFVARHNNNLIGKLYNHFNKRAHIDIFKIVADPSTTE